MSSKSSKTRSTDCTPPAAFSAIPSSPAGLDSDNSYPHCEKNCLESLSYSTAGVRVDAPTPHPRRGLCFHVVDNNIHNTKTISGASHAQRWAQPGGPSMANPSPGNSITLRVEAPSSFTATSELAAAVGAAGAAITALDVTESHHETLVVDVTCNTTDDDHANRVKDALNALDGVTVRNVSDRTFLMHLGGKLEVVPKVALRNRDDLSRAYTPGVARVCLAIAENPDAARNLTVKRNTIAVVTDGSAVLGLGNIGPAAALPVMEGKAALFKQFANVDAWPVCLDTQDTEEIIKIVKALAPVYGGVNLEDIAAPRCFEIETRLREELDIPVFHDDQHGTAIVTLAALTNALRVVGKKLPDVRIVVSGVGAAGSAIIQLLKAQGARNIIAAGRAGAIHFGEQYSD